MGCIVTFPLAYFIGHVGRASRQNFDPVPWQLEQFVFVQLL